MKIKESWFRDYQSSETDEIMQTYMEVYQDYLNELPPRQRYKECISGFNRIKRGKMWSSNALGIEVALGDICYIDYGHAYVNEAGYQHFGLVLAIFNHKLLVAPMTSNVTAVNHSRNLEGEKKSHLYFLGKAGGLNKPSVIFLNDCKFINSARIISINGNVGTEGQQFKEIINCLMHEIFKYDVIE